MLVERGQEWGVEVRRELVGAVGEEQVEAHRAGPGLEHVIHDGSPDRPHQRPRVAGELRGFQASPVESDHGDGRLLWPILEAERDLTGLDEEIEEQSI